MIVSSGVGFVEIERECVRDKERDGGKGGGGRDWGTGIIELRILLVR